MAIKRMHNTIPCNNLSTFSSTTFGRTVELKSEKEMQAMHCEEKHDDAGLGLKGPLPLKRPDGWKSEKAAQLSPMYDGCQIPPTKLHENWRLVRIFDWNDTYPTTYVSMSFTSGLRRIKVYPML